MTTTAPVSESQIIALRDGLAVPLEALRILWDLESRRFDFGIAHDGALVVSPGSNLTSVDRQTIQRHRDDLLRLVAYAEQVVA